MSRGMSTKVARSLGFLPVVPKEDSLYDLSDLPCNYKEGDIRVYHHTLSNKEMYMQHLQAVQGEYRL